MNITYDEAMRNLESEINKTVESQKTLKSQLIDNCFSIFGLLIVVVLVIWLYSYIGSISQSISVLAPSPDVAKLNIDKIGILLGTMGVEMTIFWGLYAVGMAFLAIGIAWSSHRSNARVTMITTNLIGLTTLLVSKHIREESDRLYKRLTESHNLPLRKEAANRSKS